MKLTRKLMYVCSGANVVVGIFGFALNDFWIGVGGIALASFCFSWAEQEEAREREARK